MQYNGCILCVDRQRFTYLNNSCVTASTAATETDTTKTLMFNNVTNHFDFSIDVGTTNTLIHRLYFLS